MHENLRSCKKEAPLHTRRSGYGEYNYATALNPVTPEILESTTAIVGAGGQCGLVYRQGLGTQQEILLAPFIKQYPPIRN